jgi:hypothetical protein
MKDPIAFCERKSGISIGFANKFKALLPVVPLLKDDHPSSDVVQFVRHFRMSEWVLSGDDFCESPSGSEPGEREPSDRHFLRLHRQKGGHCC